jgi:ABC-type bacteriocin/lantibiotic exporter with double-glycine peptidase domain
MKLPIFPGAHADLTNISPLARVVGWFAHLLYGVRGQRRIPVLLQLSAVECGAACLAMVLSSFGRKTTVAECRERTNVGRGGMTAQTLAEAARGFGLRVRAFSIEPEELRHAPLPAIAHWNFDHFVVVERWSPETVTIVDPGSGRQRISAAEFSEGFTGVLLLCEPGAHFERRSKAPGSSSRLRGYLRALVSEARGVLVQIIAASLLLQLLGLALPVTTQILVDRVLPNRLNDVLPLLGLGLAVIVLAQIVTSYLRSTLLLVLQARVDSRLMLGFFEHLLSLPFRFFEQRTTGDLMMRLSSNAMVRQTLTSQTLSVALDGSLVTGYLIFLFARDVAFGGLVVVIAGLQGLLLLATSRRMNDLTQRDLAAQATSQSYLVESLTGIATLKASGAEDATLGQWSNLFIKQLNVSLRRGHLAAVLDTLLNGFHTLAPLALLWIGAERVLSGSMSLGTMLAMQALATSVLSPLGSLISNAQSLQTVGAYLDRLADVMDAEPEQDRTAVRPAPALSGQVTLDHINFRYDTDGPLVLNDISLDIAPGQKVALVGRTGSGKSTLAKLLLGLYHPTSGDLRYDGNSLHEIDLRGARRQFGAVMQDPVLFSGTVRENIACSDPSLTLDQIRTAARLAEIDDDIMRLPLGYDTWLSEGGGGLSGGQRQRLALARALVGQPRLLLLDEATSHLDVVTEAQVDQHLSELDCTRIVIAHRLSTVRNADLILVLDGGTIVERGTHDELLARDGVYAALIRNQLTTDTRSAPAPTDAGVPLRIDVESHDGQAAIPPDILARLSGRPVQRRVVSLDVAASGD